VGCPWWLRDGEHDGAVAVKRAEEEEKGGAPFIATRGVERRRRKLRAGAAKPWARQSSNGHGLKAVGVVGRRCSDRSPTDGPRTVSPLSKIYPNRLKLVKSKWMPYFAPKIPNYCVILSWNILSNFLNCTDFKLLI
jgi:hypothetical protein